MAALEDAKNYLAIKPVPPWDMAKDAKLKARSFNQYNLGSPTRYDMFKANYMRRLRQMSSQGFMSSASKPYEPVGGLVLNVKDLVKKTLGQENVTQPPSTPKQSQKNDNMPSSRSARSERMSRRPATSPIYSRRASARKKKPLLELQDIPTNLSVVETTKFSVKMGHSLFEVLEAKDTEPAKGKVWFADSHSPDRDRKDSTLKEGPVMKKQDIEEDQSPPGPKSLPVPQWLVQVDSLAVVKSSREDGDTKTQSRSSMDISPQDIVDDYQQEVKTYFLWRQLCALHWLIEACRIEQGLGDRLASGERLVPLAECWNPVKPGGSRCHLDSAKLERNPSTSSLNVPSRSPSRSTICSGTNSVLQGGWSCPTTPRRIRETAWSVETPHSPSLPFSPPPAEYENEENSVFDMEDTANYHKNLVKLLDTVKESVNKEMKYREKLANNAAERTGRLRTPVYQWALTPYPQAPKSSRAPITPKPSQQLQIQTSPSLTVRRASIRPHTAGPTIKQPSQSNRRDSLYQTFGDRSPRTEASPSKRPRSSPPKLTLRLNTVAFSSNQREKTMVKLREQFKEVTDLKALRLHQSLTELQRSRWDRIEKKFEAFQVRQLGMHRDLKVMRSAVSRPSSPDRANSRLATPATAAASCEWYSKLLELTSVQDALDKPCKVVVKRLEESAAQYVGWQMPETLIRRPKSYNVMDNHITVESFVRVFRQLRPFEIFAPDVSAAIEFMKSYILKMPNEPFTDLVKKMV